MSDQITRIEGGGSGVELATPSSSVLNFQSAAISANTARAYASDWKQFVAWCEPYGISPIPAPAMMVANYIADRAELVNDEGDWLYAPATIARWIASINKAHKVAGHMAPGTHPDVQNTLSGIRRLHARPPKRVRPLLLDDLRKVLNAVNLRTFPQGVIATRDSMTLLMGFAGAFRRSELTNLALRDITPHPEDGLHIRLFITKTDQEGRGSVKAIPYGANPITCAPCAFARWTRILDAWNVGRPQVMRELRKQDPNIHICLEPHDALGRLDRSLPLLRAVNKSGVIGTESISGHVINAIVKRRVGEIGYSELGYGGHSLRSGFITQGFRAGASAHEIMRQTGHTDPATLEIYNRENDPLRQNAVTRIGL